MKDTKKLAISAMTVALGVAIMALGALVEALDLSVCMLASLLIVVIYIEMGSPHVWLIWLATSLAAWLVFPGSVIWLEYLFIFGVYPILKAYIERLPRRAWLPIKLAFVNSVTWLLIFLVDLVLGFDFFGTDILAMKFIIYVLVNVAFIAYDKLIELFARLYVAKYRKRFERFFK